MDEIEKEEQKQHLQKVSYKHGSTLCETIVNKNGHFQFACLQNDKVSIVDSFDDGYSVIQPAFDLRPMWESGTVTFPSRAAEYGTQDDLVREIKEFISRYASIPDDWVLVSAHYVLMSWVYDKFCAVPYLRFLGEPQTGKTRILQVVGALSFNSLSVSGNITGPALFRSIDLVRGTLVVDEADFNSEDWSDITKILNSGYMRGFPIIRCNPGRRFRPESFEVYGPKVISTRKRFIDSALETRCITFETRELALPDYIPLQLPQRFYEEAEELRNKALRWRFDNFARIGSVETDVRHLEPRLGQIGASLMAISGNEEAYYELMGFLTEYSDNGKTDTPKAVVVQALVQMQGKTTRTVKEIARTACQIASDIDLEDMTSKRVGLILRSLGFLPKRTRIGYVVTLDKARVAELQRLYGVNE